MPFYRIFQFSPSHRCMKMNKGSDILFCAIRTALNSETFDCVQFQSLSQDDWQELLRLSQQHNVLPIVCDGLAQTLKKRPEKGKCLSDANQTETNSAQNAERPNILPSIVAKQLAGLTIVLEDKYSQRVKVIETLAQLFAEYDIPLLVLKGYGVSLYYPVPNHRSFSDVDIYNFGQIKKADRLAAQKLGVTIDDDVHHHTRFVFNGVLVENHYDFVETHSHRSSVLFEKMLKGEAHRGYTEHVIGNRIIRLPSPMFNALFLMRHMASHYAAERVSVRHLCDWKQYVEHDGRKINWQLINAIYEQFNMKRFADAVTRICIEYLGMNPNIIPNTKSDRVLENRIINDILYAEFDEPKPAKGAIRIVWWKMRRFWANRWKHELIYNESWAKTFFYSTYSHLLKPKTITH